ncbi:hypothetical protein CC1G_08274 [Coprinopsis cinerea okayama7|uniref:SWIM-type domain-containing protein n=1 Tax=Coprinopsis cinerea (strain Okayama-7 / 130 / ATCC MYA-4618 / FGSC 9003) TaxID=240176 RepID=A8PG28_COPC7|nr:hypothetical protein CC1G_08274 [Coprinopsis cinerea okayama7\|eukprot:XP_001841130.2 hypothetical protein CC1G_08274 [Coprinopsis cinerea okayama7\
MVLKRKRGDEWVEVKPRRGSSPPAMIPPVPAPGTSIPTTTMTSRATRSSTGTAAGPSSYSSTAGYPTTSTMGYSYNYADRAPVTPVKKARLASDSPEIVAVSSGGYRSGSSLNMPGRSTNTAATTTTSRTAARRTATTQVSQHPSLGLPPPSALYQLPQSQPPPPTKAKATRKGKKKAVEEEYGHAPGSSQPGSSQPSSSQGTRGRKPAPEKRLARFKPSCPQNIIDRLERVQMQTFYMLDRNRNGDELKETFQVSGSTGNVYTVVIDKIPSCTCPDAMKGNHCKHILFIFTKVLHVPRSSGSWYQKALLTDELQEIFDNAPAAPNAGVTNARVQEAYLRSIGRGACLSDFRHWDGVGLLFSSRLVDTLAPHLRDTLSHITRVQQPPHNPPHHKKPKRKRQKKATTVRFVTIQCIARVKPSLCGARSAGMRFIKGVGGNVSVFYRSFILLGLWIGLLEEEDGVIGVVGGGERGGGLVLEENGWWIVAENGTLTPPRVRFRVQYRSSVGQGRYMCLVSVQVDCCWCVLVSFIDSVHEEFTFLYPSSLCFYYAIAIPLHLLLATTISTSLYCRYIRTSTSHLSLAPQQLRSHLALNFSVSPGPQLSVSPCFHPGSSAISGAGGAAARATGATVRGGYLNLAGVAGLSPVRDTSTYYHGPRRGQRYYGAQYYDDD